MIDDHPCILSYVVTMFVLRLASVILVFSDNYLLSDTIFSKTKDFDETKDSVTNQMQKTASILGIKI